MLQKADLFSSLINERVNMINELSESIEKALHCQEDVVEGLSFCVPKIVDTLLRYSEIEKTDLKKLGQELNLYAKNNKITTEMISVVLNEIRKYFQIKIESLPINYDLKLEGITQLGQFIFELQSYTMHLLIEDLEEELDNERELIQEQEKNLKKLQGERTQVLSKLSNSFAHELRNPLTSIKGFVQLLESRLKKVTDEKMYFQYINHEINELENQVNQLLFLSSYKTHQDYKIQRISSVSLIVNAIQTFHLLLIDNNIQLDVKLEKDRIINGVEEQIKLAFYKLIQNAVEALLMKEKGRKLKIELKLDEDIVIIVSNNGPPIPDVLKDSIFDPFVSTKELGKGLGLSITKQIVEKHQGEIICISEGSWTTFMLKFPREQIINI
ncbi:MULTISPECIES: sensor histidine kinase [Bacillaceae]|uniref:histidine kinase n=1 Tax=Evansella alkalicola TaxID=745819 RepID=A0ABS6JQ78_9BACI|nr:MULTISPECIES: HAMP domain-containing sensor histidine kinase [Bacillaceae]MBU9720709.1 HAMP domain-containing histidine kinase [Bacillus alkalicola]